MSPHCSVFTPSQLCAAPAARRPPSCCCGLLPHPLGSSLLPAHVLVSCPTRKLHEDRDTISVGPSTPSCAQCLPHSYLVKQPRTAARRDDDPEARGLPYIFPIFAVRLDGVSDGLEGGWGQLTSQNIVSLNWTQSQS